MITVVNSVCIDADSERVWSRLAALEEIRLWSEPVLDARCDGPIRSGGGAQRTCGPRGGITITEHWTAWEPGHSFTYEGRGLPGVAFATNTWTVQPVGARTQRQTRAEVQLKGGRVARWLFEPLVRRQSQRTGTRSLEAFKHLVEHGSPPAGRHARLAPVPTVC
jgi:hypothetical protein